MSQQVSFCACRGVEVTYHKVRAHTERKHFAEVAQRADGQLRADALGNLQADALAVEAAGLLQLPEVLIRAACEGIRCLVPSCAGSSRSKPHPSKATEPMGSLRGPRALGPQPPRPSSSAFVRRGTAWKALGDASNAADADVSSGGRVRANGSL